MKTIEYRVTYANGVHEILFAVARDINSGFAKVLKKAKEPLGDGTKREIHSVEFWMVIS